MAGDHCGVLLADAYQKGYLADFSEVQIDTLYQTIRKSALEIPPPAEYTAGKGRRGIEYYLDDGFIPLEATISEAYHWGNQVNMNYNIPILISIIVRMLYTSTFICFMTHGYIYVM